MKTILAWVQKFLHDHPKVRSAVRDARWQIKKVPLINRISIAFDTAYFKNAGDERLHAENADGRDEYAEAYWAFISPRVHGQVLDVGCGSGYLTKRIAANPKVQSVVGVDKIQDFQTSDPKITYVTDDLTRPKDFPGTFDVVVSSEFIEHVREVDCRKILAKITKALKPGGVFIGSTPHNPTAFKTFSGSRFHIREYNEKDLTRLLKDFFGDVVVTALSTHCLVWEAKQPRSYIL